MSIYGGTLDEIPLPHRLRSETPGEKRRVTVTLTSFGPFIGMHTYVDIRVATDEIWNSEKKTWQTPWKHDFLAFKMPDELKGSTKFNSVRNAVSFAKKIVKKYFSDESFRIEFQGMTESLKKLLRDAIRPEGD